MTAPTCRSCSAPILWTKTAGGKLFPVDAEPDADWPTPLLDPAGTIRPTGKSVAGRSGSVPLVTVLPHTTPPADPEDRSDRRWRAHWTTCPNADAWRRPRTRKRNR